ncbi:GNAT family N-acetyltransferase [Allosphingosinicella flava]|uniref:GNAT family N-acetyltransferase n=1 Tax=Allosphingosinicella flava TaxID=2771430 RepID=A0A7T2GJ64_9SPHN|nr:GNAT family N-acetyltransferase [Sphingosinicella flava]QPQ54829.1 GNAT family N-acetyltransferase [Sphingosinicella flava]
MTGISYRMAGTADAAMLASLARRTFTETFGHLYKPEDLAAFLESHSTERWAEELASPGFAVRIALSEGEAVAFIKIGPPTLPFTPVGPSIELRQFYVLKPWQGAGIAPALMDWAIGEARRRGAEHLYLSVFTDNHRARRFYARYGFTEIGPYAFKVGTHVDEDIVMHLALEARP